MQRLSHVAAVVIATLCFQILKSLEAISRFRALIKEQGVEKLVLLSLLCCNAQGSQVLLRALTKSDYLLRREEIYDVIAQSIS